MNNFVHLVSFLTSLQEFENFIAKFRDSGFVLVALGSMVNLYQSREVLREMNGAFAHLSQGVIWKYNPSHWPKDVKLAANVKIVDWLPQNDLLGKDYPIYFSLSMYVSSGLHWATLPTWEGASGSKR